MATSRYAPRYASGGEDGGPGGTGETPPIMTPPGGAGVVPPGMKTSATAPFVDPSFYRTPSFPYANLADQLKDALGLSSRGGGVYANQMTGRLQAIKNMLPNLGGGLLGMTAYARGTPYTGGGGGYGPVTPGSGPAGTPTPPGGYAPGAPMPRPPGPGSGLLPPGPGTTRPPGQGSPGYTMPTPFGGGTRGGVDPAAGFGTRAGMGGGMAKTGLLGSSIPYSAQTLASWQDAQKYMDPAEKARLGSQVTSQGIYNPGHGDQDIGTLMSNWDGMDDSTRGNFINALGQYTGANLGASTQQALRAKMGQGAFDNWYAGVQNRQGSNIMSTAGLPAWLTAAIK